MTVALKPSEPLDNVLVELVELQLFDEDLWMDGQRPAQATAALVEVEDGVEARATAIEEQFTLDGVEVASTFGPVAEQGFRIAFERGLARMEPHTAHVDHHSVVVCVTDDVTVGGVIDRYSDVIAPCDR